MKFDLLLENYWDKEIATVTDKLLHTDILKLVPDKLDIFIEECETWLENTIGTLRGLDNNYDIKKCLRLALRQKRINQWTYGTRNKT